MKTSICKKCDKVFNYRVGSNSHKTSNGHTPWNKGLKIPELSGENHSAWKGEKCSYRTLHFWVERHIGRPNKCSECGKVGYGHNMHWANKSGHYKRKLTDWVRLCVKCHKAHDRNKLVLSFQ